MRQIDFNKSFKKDYKRVSRSRYADDLGEIFENILNLLSADEELPAKYRDHAMIGNWADHRNCHIKPDLVLIYQKPDVETLLLVRLGSHSELGI